MKKEKAEMKVHQPLRVSLARDWRLYLMMILPLAFYILFCYKPMVGVVIAFQKFNMFSLRNQMTKY